MSYASAEPPDGTSTRAEPQGHQGGPSGWSAVAPTRAVATTREGDPGLRASSFFFDFRNHHGFEVWIDFSGIVNAISVVVASICELHSSGDPHQGLASMEVHNIVPHDDGLVIVRGYIGWDTDLNARLNILVQ